MKRLLIISLIILAGCTRIAHIGEDGGIVIDRPDLYSATAKTHEEGHQAGLYHCWNIGCYMYFMDAGATVLCPRCEAKLRPTVRGWLGLR